MVRTHLLRAWVVLDNTQNGENPSATSWQHFTLSKTDPLQNLSLIIFGLAFQLIVGHDIGDCVAVL